MQNSVTESTPNDSASKYDNKSYRYYALAAFIVIYIFNFLDRQILVILQEPIKQEFSLTDTQLSLLTGFAFALFYVTMGLPIARLADHGGRRNIVAAAVCLWSAFTAACGLVTNYVQLLFARIGVGVGEAGCSPPIHSMISDIFPANERATALAAYNIAINIGILAGFLAGGWLNELFSWRVAFFAAGIPGIIIAIVFRLTVVEPPRGTRAPRRPVTVDEEEMPGSLEVCRVLWQSPTARHMAIATALVGLSSYALINWLPSFFIRSYGLGTGTVGTWLALTLGIGGGTGTFLIGYLSDRYARQDLRLCLWIPAISIAVTVPFIAAIFLVNDSTLALLSFLLPGSLLTAYFAPVIAVAHGLVKNSMRAFSSAIFLLVVNLFGLGLGPLLAGALSDCLAPYFAADSLRMSLLMICPVTMAWAVVHFHCAAKSLNTELSD